MVGSTKLEHTQQQRVKHRKTKLKRKKIFKKKNRKALDFRFRTGLRITSILGSKIDFNGQTLGVGSFIIKKD